MVDKLEQDWLLEIAANALLFCLGNITEESLDSYLANEIPEYLWEKLNETGQDILVSYWEKA